MPDIEITVRGVATATHPPERATVHLAAAAQGADRAQVHQQASAAAQAITDSILPLAGDGGPVARWSSGQLHLGTQREYQGGRKDRAVLVHRADVQFRARFRRVEGGGSDGGAGTDGFAALNSWLSAIAAVDDVEVRNVRWTLTGARREQVSEQVRSAAVRDAQQRAAAYARDLGMATVRPIAVADPGLLGARSESGGWSEQAGGRVASLGSHSMNVDLVPQDIEVRAAVDMRFAAADGAD